MIELIGHYAFDTSALARLLAARAAAPVYVADLSLGGWRPNSVAAQMATQLGVALPPPPESYRHSGGHSLAYADVVSAGIDAEATGNRSVRMALRLVSFMRELFAAKPATLLVIAPRFGIAWEEEDTLFLEFMAREVPSIELEIVACDLSPTIPDGWTIRFGELGAEVAAAGQELLGLIPEVITAQTLTKLGAQDDSHLVLLANGSSIAGPELRRAPRQIPKLLFDRLTALFADSDPELASYGQFFGMSYHVEPAKLCQRAWDCFARGGLGLAIRYLERAERCAANPVEKAAYTCQKLGMRIARLRFREIAAEPSPSNALPTPLKAFLLQAKGWSLVQIGQAKEARELLAAAERLTHEKAQAAREHLYLLNIRALSEFRCGNSGGALELEERIETGLNELPAPDWRLEYVNAVNQARLHRALKHWDRSSHYYEKAFQTTLGLRSESDHVYTNLCRALVTRASVNEAASLYHWVRATLHWLAVEWPEELTARIMQALLPGMALSETSTRRQCEDLIESISKALLGNLDKAAIAAGIVLPDTAPARSFYRADDDSVGLLTLVGGSGWSVIAADRGERFVKRRGAAYRDLERLMCRFIAVAHPATPGDCFVIDGRFGKEIASTLAEAQEVCALRSIEDLRFDGLRSRVPARLIEDSGIARLGHGVAFVKNRKTVEFKRYLSPFAMDSQQAAIVATLAAGPVPVNEFLQHGHSLDELRLLERRRVLDITVETTRTNFIPPPVAQEHISGGLHA
ncbi:MAG TPA: hypothetical protein VGL53_15785 [Bryobacteraceae bacterium]|jgi:hypothetical protein